MKSLDEPSGILTRPFRDVKIPPYDLRKMSAYCRAKGIEPYQLSKKEKESFLAGESAKTAS